ncbi:MAG: hypothetical protein ACRDZV_07315 [Acidimicrobiia bacterium]
MLPDDEVVELVRRTTAACGVPYRLADPAVAERVAAALTHVEAPSQQADSAPVRRQAEPAA